MHLIKKIKEHIFIRSEDYSIQDVVLIHMLHITYCLALLSAFSSLFLEFRPVILWSIAIALVYITVIYFIVRIKKEYLIGRRLYMIFVLIFTNVMWIETEGSSGPTLYCLLAFFPLFVFTVRNKKLKYGFITIAINLPILLIIELYYPKYINQYESDLQRIYDIILVCFVFVLFEVPLLIKIKKSVISERNAAQHSERMKTSNITNLSHEIRTPMNAIIGFAELLEDEDIENDDRLNYVRIINDNGQTLLNLLNNIINISKIEEEQARIAVSEINPSEIMQRVHSALSYNTNNSNVDFSIMNRKNAEHILLTDSIMLYQILVNLTFNALKFTTKGFVNIGYNLIGDKITFYVEDSGIGISEDKQAGIFNEFAQDNNGKALNIHGSGLGLTISKSLAAILKGKLYFKSEKNVGSTFYLELPLRFQE